MTVASAHHDKHRKLRAEHFVAELLHPADFMLDPRVALNQRDVAERVGGALRHVAVIQLDLALQRLAFRDDQRDQRREHASIK